MITTYHGKIQIVHLKKQICTIIHGMNILQIIYFIQKFAFLLSKFYSIVLLKGVVRPFLETYAINVLQKDNPSLYTVISLYISYVHIMNSLKTEFDFVCLFGYTSWYRQY